MTRIGSSDIQNIDWDMARPDLTVAQISRSLNRRNRSSSKLLSIIQALAATVDTGLQFAASH
jgi:hypothetical protein